MENNLGEQIAWLINENFKSIRQVIKEGKTDFTPIHRFEYLAELEILNKLTKEQLINIILENRFTTDAMIEELQNEDETLWEEF